MATNFGFPIDSRVIVIDPNHTCYMKTGQVLGSVGFGMTRVMFKNEDRIYERDSISTIFNRQLKLATDGDYCFE